MIIAFAVSPKNPRARVRVQQKATPANVRKRRATRQPRRIWKCELKTTKYFRNSKNGAKETTRRSRYTSLTLVAAVVSMSFLLLSYVAASFALPSAADVQRLFVLDKPRAGCIVRRLKCRVPRKKKETYSN